MNTQIRIVIGTTSAFSWEQRCSVYEQTLATIQALHGHLGLVLTQGEALVIESQQDLLGRHLIEVKEYYHARKLYVADINYRAFKDGLKALFFKSRKEFKRYENSKAEN